MKKSLAINIRGIVFNIDDDAYELLNKYLAEINSHYKNQLGQEDIMSDIENRIVELMQEKLSDKKQVVTKEDVEEIIGVLGRPSDFEDELEEELDLPGWTEELVEDMTEIYDEDVFRIQRIPGINLIMP